MNTLQMVGVDLTLCDKVLLSDAQRANWDIAVLGELAAASTMELVAVLDAQDGLIDFAWRFADPLATLTLGHAGANLSGTRLMQLPDQLTLGAVLFRAYRSVWQSSQPQSVQVNCGDWSGAHHIRRSVDGVSVLVTSPAAVERFKAARRRLLAVNPQPQHCQLSL